MTSSDPSSRVSVEMPAGADGNAVLTRIAEAGMRPGPDVQECGELAAGAQLSRQTRGRSDRPLVTRSTLLWALARRSPGVRAALSAGGVELDALGHKLGITEDPEPLRVPFRLDAELDAAMRADLAERPEGAVIGPEEIATALVVAATRDNDAGLLGQRLDELQADRAAILRALSGAAPPGSGTEGGSGPVYRVRDVPVARFGVQGVSDVAELGAYFPRSVDAELDAALRSDVRAVLVVAPAMSGAVRTVYEALKRVRPDERVLVASELIRLGTETAVGVEELDRLLENGVDLVWIPSLRQVADYAPQFLEWFRSSISGGALSTLLVTVVRPEHEQLIADLGLSDTGPVRVVRMEGRLTGEERSRTEARFGRELPLVSDVVRASVAERRRVRANFNADSFDAQGLVHVGSDDLGIKADVDMMAALIASKSVLPPLSIGLFGQWGSGKSFFMHQIQLRIMDFAERSRRLEKEGSSVFCSEVVPVSFNAWQYARGVDLWASLINRVFEGIREHLRGDDRYVKALRTVETQNHELARAQRELDRAEAEVQRSEAAQGDRSIAAVAEDDVALGDSVRTLEATISLDPARTQIGALRAEVARLRTVGGRFAKGWSGASSLRRGMVVGLGLLGVASLVVVWSAGDLPAAARTVASLLALLVPVLTTLNAVLRPARLALEAGNALLEADEVDKRRYEEAKQRRDQAAEALEEARKAGPAELYEYVADRSTAPEYRQALGMAPIIRTDLARLAAMAGENGDAPGIERVVLFIDDLDRCPASDVVRVLEAVNLLFGFPLFVVVVAVDSRWLVHSLESEFSEVFDQDDVSAPTPRNYLEKIIQIPFWLSPMGEQGFGRLITKLVGETEDVRAAATTSPATSSWLESDDWAGPEAARFHGPAAGPDVPPAPPPGTEPAATSDGAESTGTSDEDLDLNPEALRITPGERDYMHGFSGLVRTPRAAKRFLNTYQLLRSGVRDVETFLGEEQYKPVLVLLALLTGTSLVDDRMVAQLRTMREPDFEQFLEARSEDEWVEISTACADLPVDLLTPAVIDRWLSTVGRYSFHPTEA